MLVGILPETVRSVADSAPAAAATSFVAAIRVTDDDVMAPSESATRTLRLNFVPALRRDADDPPFPWTRKPNGPPLPRDGALVTVMSVPTPYSECSTVPWAFFSPDDAAVTVMTSPMPTARPSAMKLACRIRRRSSRPR